MKQTATLFAACLLLMGCAAEFDRYGVVLTAPERVELGAGTLVRASEVSDVTGLVTVVPLDREREYALKPGYVKCFDSEADARLYLEQYDPYRTRYGRASVQALRVRAEPHIESEDLYRLRKDERVKLVSRLSRRTNVGGQIGHWYEVVTSDGQQGFVFGPLLNLEGAEAGTAFDPEDDPVESIDSFLATVWRPAYMREMLASGRLDLTRFDPHIGLFPEPDRGRVVLNTAKSRLVFEPLDVQPIGDNTVELAGGDLQIHFTGDPRVIVVRYEHAGVAVRERYVDLEVEIEEVIEKERERRERIYQSIMDYGMEFESRHYGRLTFQEGGRVRWTNRDAVVPQLIPQSAPDVAIARFNRYLAPRLRDTFDGSLTLLFAMPSRDRSIVFLYELESGGLRLTHVPTDDMSGVVIERRPRSPLAMFFETVREGTDEPGTVSAR